MIYSGLWVGRHWGLTVIGIVRNFVGGWPRCRVSGRSSCKARGVLLLVVCGLTNVTCGGDQAATLADDPKSLVTMGGLPDAACSLGGGLELTVLEDLGAGRLGDDVTVFVFAWVLLSSGMLMNTGILNLHHLRLFVKILRRHVVSVSEPRLETVSDV